MLHRPAKVLRVTKMIPLLLLLRALVTNVDVVGKLVLEAVAVVLF